MNRLIKRKTQIAERQSIIKKRLIAMTENVKEIPANTSLNVFKDEYDKLMKNDFKLNDSTHNNQGIFGEFAYKSAGDGVENPIIYLREVFHFTDPKGFHECVVVEHKYDTNGSVISTGYRVYEDYNWRQMVSELKSGNVPCIIDNGTLYEISGATTYNDAKAEVDKIVNTKKRTAI